MPFCRIMYKRLEMNKNIYSTQFHGLSAILLKPGVFSQDVNGDAIRSYMPSLQCFTNNIVCISAFYRQCNLFGIPKNVLVFLIYFINGAYDNNTNVNLGLNVRHIIRSPHDILSLLLI